jgi:methylthioribose-1-phosphate isomerase
MKLNTIGWKNGRVKLIDQSKLPGRLQYIYVDNLRDLRRAIRTMKVRGAPALGAAAGLGVYLGLRKINTKSFSRFKKEMERVIGYIGSSRPTARNLFWGLERMRNSVLAVSREPVDKIKKIILAEAQRMIDEDKSACRNIGRCGEKLIKDKDGILTICNAGILATIDYGTALGVVYRASEQGKKIKVFACETRPMLQGARLTAWELNRKGIDTTLICDSMAAVLMQQGKIGKVIAGADRIAANGDAANKIGTYNLAVLSRYHRIPFYIAAPASTFDLSIKSGRQIPIEQRKPSEVSTLFFKKPIAPAKIKIFNPAFDVTPQRLITALITDKGVIRPPFKKNIAKVLGRKNAHS